MGCRRCKGDGSEERGKEEEVCEKGGEMEREGRNGVEKGKRERVRRREPEKRGWTKRVERE